LTVVLDIVLDPGAVRQYHREYVAHPGRHGHWIEAAIDGLHRMRVGATPGVAILASPHPDGPG
jgi:hypothetical protein